MPLMNVNLHCDIALYLQNKIGMKVLRPPSNTRQGNSGHLTLKRQISTFLNGEYWSSDDHLGNT